MEKIKTIIGILCIAGTYFTAHYASTTSLMGMSVWSAIMTVMLFFAGMFLIIGDNTFE